MAPIPAALATFFFITVTLVSRYLSLGSIVGVIVACLSLVGLTVAGMYSSTYWVYAFLGRNFYWDFFHVSLELYSSIYWLYSFLGGAMIIWQHRDNIQRILRGNERRLGQPAGKAD
jgi:glycerol-3-phosphate acyltransferase PlsY